MQAIHQHKHSPAGAYPQVGACSGTDLCSEIASSQVTDLPEEIGFKTESRHKAYRNHNSRNESDDGDEFKTESRHKAYRNPVSPFVSASTDMFKTESRHKAYRNKLSISVAASGIGHVQNRVTPQGV